MDLLSSRIFPACYLSQQIDILQLVFRFMLAHADVVVMGTTSDDPNRTTTELATTQKSIFDSRVRAGFSLVMIDDSGYWW